MIVYLELPGFSWIYDKINKSLFKLASDNLVKMFDWIIDDLFDLLFKYHSVEAIQKNTIDFSPMLTVMQGICVSLALLFIASEGIERQGKALLGSQKENSLLPIIGSSVLSITCIYYLPKKFMNVLLFANESLLTIIKTKMSFDKNIMYVGLTDMLPTQSQIFAITEIIAFLVILIGFIVLAVHAGIRFVEIMIAVLIAPLMAALIIKDKSYIINWLKETCAIVFTQSIHGFLFIASIRVVMENKIMFESLKKGEFGSSIMDLMFFIGLLVVACRGPKILRNYLFNSGAGGGMLGLANSGMHLALNRSIRNSINNRAVLKSVKLKGGK